MFESGIVSHFIEKPRTDKKKIGKKKKKKNFMWKFEEKNPLPPISLSDNFKQTFFKGWPHKILISLTEYLPILFGKIYYIPMLRLMAIYIMSEF